MEQECVLNYIFKDFIFQLIFFNMFYRFWYVYHLVSISFLSEC